MAAPTAPKAAPACAGNGPRTNRLGSAITSPIKRPTEVVNAAAPRCDTLNGAGELLLRILRQNLMRVREPALVAKLQAAVEKLERRAAEEAGPTR